MMQKWKAGRVALITLGRAQDGFVTCDHATDYLFSPGGSFPCWHWQEGEEKRTCFFSVRAKLVDPP